jgi:hypothetical protein
MIATQPDSDRRLRDSSWAMFRYNYSAERRAAFYAFVKRVGLPHIRLGSRKMLFDPVAVEAFEARRSLGGERASASLAIVRPRSTEHQR